MPFVHPDPPSVSLAAATTTVGVTASAIPATALAGRRTLVVYNNGTDYIYIGPAAVTTATGLPIPPGGMRAFDASDKVLMFAISPTAGQDVRTLEQS